jgi:hypothetical protein
MKNPEFKRSGIRLIAEFRGIPNGFPNLGSIPRLWNQPFQVGKHHGFVSWQERLGVRCYDCGLTGPALMLWLVFITTVVPCLGLPLPLPQQ